MREDLVLDTIRQILIESGNEEYISLSTEPNRLANIMVCKQMGTSGLKAAVPRGAAEGNFKK